ncbi:MAG: SRPBCC domain-containing protein [Actinomycetota bacterium]
MEPTERAELEVRRVVPATPERTFAAWTSPDQLVQWWGPPGGRCRGAEVDLRVGGRYEIVNELPDGSIVSITGHFVDVGPPDRLSYTWATGPVEGPEELVTVQFKAHADGTEVVVSHQRITDPGRVANTQMGWGACLDGLVALFSRNEQRGS